MSEQHQSETSNGIPPAGATDETTNSIPAIDDMDMVDRDPLLRQPPNVVREGDFMILLFADGKHLFAQALKSWKGKSPPVKINKRSYPTANLIGLPYGTVLELTSSGLVPLPEGADVVPEFPAGLTSDGFAAEGQSGNLGSLEDDEANAEDNTFPTVTSGSSTNIAVNQKSDNRNLVDDNTSQSLHESEIHQMRQLGAHGSAIVNRLIQNSSTFDQKTEFSKAKYVARKQKKYQPRCRIVRCTPHSVCEAVFKNRPRQLLNMREDTLGQILSYSNVSAGCQVLIFEQCMGVVTGALAHRMGGYGKILSIYTGQQPSFVELIQRYNLTFAESHSIKWVHSGDVFGEDDVTSTSSDAQDPEKEERESLVWPCVLQDHTRKYLETMGTDREKKIFLAKRCARFARKLTRHTAMESKEWLQTRKCDSIVLAVRYDPTATLLSLLQYLAPSSPFVVYCEFIEPLTECFLQLQKQQLAINLRLSDTWMREYQVLPGRTHPSMNMTQSGGFILTGIKLCPETGHNELDDSLLKELRVQVGGRRGRKNKPKAGGDGSKPDLKIANGNAKSINADGTAATKRIRAEESDDHLSGSSEVKSDRDKKRRRDRK